MLEVFFYLPCVLVVTVTFPLDKEKLLPSFLLCSEYGLSFIFFFSILDMNRRQRFLVSVEPVFIVWLEQAYMKRVMDSLCLHWLREVKTHSDFIYFFDNLEWSAEFGVELPGTTSIFE